MKFPLILESIITICQYLLILINIKIIYILLIEFGYCWVIILQLSIILFTKRYDFF